MGFDDVGYTPNTDLKAEIIKDFGFDLVVHHAPPQKSGNELTLKRLSDFYRAHNTQWILNLESANWIDAFSNDKGRDWYDHADGRHYFMFPDEVLESLSTLSHKPRIMMKNHLPFLKIDCQSIIIAFHLLPFLLPLPIFLYPSSFFLWQLSFFLS